MIGISGEHLLILAGLLLIFGPSRIPRAGAVLGKAVRNFRDAVKGIHEPEYRRLDAIDGEDQHGK